MLSIDLIKYGYKFSKKIRNYTDTIFYSVQNFLLKLSAVQALLHEREQISVEDVELGYLDLFELLHHSYLYIQKKIPGTLSDGETWQGAADNDKIVLMWLYEQGATSQELSQVTIKGYKKKIEEVFNVKGRQSDNIYDKHKESGWIDTLRKYGSDTKVWLTFEPEGSSLSFMHIHAHNAHAQSINAIKEEFLLDDFNYYSIYYKYYSPSFGIEKIEENSTPSVCDPCVNMRECGNSTIITTPTTPITVAITSTPTTTKIQATPTPREHIPMREYDDQGNLIKDFNNNKGGENV